MRELELMVEAQHENIVEVSSVFFKDDDPEQELCYSMPIVKSGDLFNEIMFKDITNHDNSKSNYDEFIYDTLIQILKALSYLHEGLRITHRDIKPHNILFDTNFEVKLADFGTGKKVQETFNEAF